MPVEHVQLVSGHEVEHSPHGLLAEEMPAFVEKHPAPGERRIVLYLHARIAPAVARPLGQLQQRLAGVERAGVVGRLHGDSAGRHGKDVPLLRYRCVRRARHRNCVRVLFRREEPFPGRHLLGHRNQAGLCFAQRYFERLRLLHDFKPGNGQKAVCANDGRARFAAIRPRKGIAAFYLQRSQAAKSHVCNGAIWNCEMAALDIGEE